MFSRAIELDPDFASAYGMAARCYLQRKGFGWVADREPRDRRNPSGWRGEPPILGREDAVALCAAGAALVVVVGDFEDGAALIDRSLALNPNLAWAWHFSALAKAFLGEPETAIEHVARAMRLSPQDPQMFGMQVVAAWAHFFAGRDDRGLVVGGSGVARSNRISSSRHASPPRPVAMAGRPRKRRKPWRACARSIPRCAFPILRTRLPIRRPQDFDRWAEGLRKAGLPE